MKVLCIGDLHIQSKNLIIFKKFQAQILNYIENNSSGIDMIVLLGDILHTMDVLKTVCMNTALEFFKSLLKFEKPIYIIVGNHDFIGPNEILSKNHWMSNIFLGEYSEHIEIVDNIVIDDNLLFLPYVPPGKFNRVLENINLKSIKYIFCHQEFKDAVFEFAAIKSDKGDIWDEKNPTIISGHIHKKQWLQKNIYYVGTPYQTRFNEEQDKSVILLDTISGKITEIFLQLPKLITLSVEIDTVVNLLQYNFIADNKYKIIITSPSLQKTQLFVKNQIYKKLKQNSNVEFLFKYTKEIFQQKITPSYNFKDVLYKNISSKPNLVKIYNELFTEQ